ncbi:uncharacterized protein [Thunnus thynnus]|uniref:uncharacterized protein n=1 Tax=Thunnus thynnus TaxID=8237 RepID=UPI003529275B
MMAVLVSSGALLLVLLTGASYSYPTKKRGGFDSSASYSGNYGANPGSASTGSYWEVPSSNAFAPAAPGFEVASETAVAPAHPGTALGSGPNYYQPSVPNQPTASYSSNSFAQPAPSGSVSSFPAGLAQPSSFQPAPKDIAWVVAPPHPFSGEEASERPEASSFVSRKPAPAPLGPSNVSPPGPPPPPVFQAGELSHMENIYEHGNFESETEDTGFQPPPPGVQVSAEQGFTSEPQPSGLGRGLVGYPHYDYMFLTGQYPPGTVTHYSSSFEQGRDHWQDAHYIRYHYPSSPSTQQVKIFPTEPAAPQVMKQPSQPTQPRRFVQPHLSSPGAGYNTRTRFDIKA